MDEHKPVRTLACQIEKHLSLSTAHIAIMLEVIRISVLAVTLGKLHSEADGI